MKNILISGSNSFIGSHFKHNSPDFQTNDVCLIKNGVSSIDFSNIDVVFHVAAIVHQDKSIPESKYFEINSDLAFNLAKKAKEYGVKQFVFMSTVKVYGENSTVQNPWTEESECHPTDSYGKSKLDAEYRLMKLNDEQFIVSIIRTPVVYGVGVKGNIQRISKFVKAWKLIPLKGIENKRAMVYIGNLLVLIHEVIRQQKDGIFLAGDGHMLSTSDFVSCLISASNEKKYSITFPIIFQKMIKLIKPNLYYRLFGSIVIDNTKTFKELNFQPPFTPRQGLQEVMKSI